MSAAQTGFPTPEIKSGDRELVLRAQSGDPSAFREIYDRYFQYAYQTALMHLRSKQEAEDVAQDAMIRVHRAIGAFRGDSALKTWIHKIARNLAYNRYYHLLRRRHYVTDSLDRAAPDGTHAGFMHELIPCPREDFREEAHLEAWSRDVERALTLMSPGHRRILAMRMDEDLDYTEIAARMGTQVGTVKSRLARARASLRAHLSEIHGGPRAPVFHPRITGRPPRAKTLVAFSGPACGCGQPCSHRGMCVARWAVRRQRAEARAVA